MFHVGAHVSISDGPAAAVHEQEEVGGNVGQIFVGSPRGWKVSEFTDDDGTEFTETHDASGMGPWIVHGTYLINFATPKDDLAEKSISTVQAELEACATLGIPYYVFHPGAHTGAGVETGIENVATRLSAVSVPDSVMVLLENTAGKGTTIGKRFAELNRMAEESDLEVGEDIGYCLDTCHLYAAGYDFTTDDGMDDMTATLDEELGIKHVRYLHLNDSSHPLGSEKDEHEHIGEGHIGDQGFENFINHPSLRDLPMVLETPANDKGYEWNITRTKELRH